MDLSNLMRHGSVRPRVLGHRKGKLIVDMSHVKSEFDESSGLHVVPLDQIFLNPTDPILVFGTPNVALVTPSEDASGWQRFAAFMFYRDSSYVADTKGRVQAGVLAQIVGLPEEALQALRESMTRMSGKRGPSCAHSNALVLHHAGFTSGPVSLRTIYRPSQLAARLWQYGLQYRGQDVEVQFIQTNKLVSDHFVSVWKREYTSLVRLYKKYIVKSHKSTAPVFDPRDEAIRMDTSAWQGGNKTSIGISCPSKLGVNLSYIFGEQPIFSCILPEYDINELREPLKAFPGKLDRVTKLKKYILFNRFVIWLFNKNLEADTTWFEQIPTRAITEMLQLSPGPERETAFVYNYTMTHKVFRIKRLLNNNGRDSKLLNWLMAKHVMLCNWSKYLKLGGELWAYRDESDQLIVCINDGSGTYKPSAERLPAAAPMLAEFFETEVHAVPR